MSADETAQELFRTDPLKGTDKSKSLAERVREIADTEHPWIPGAQADLIREIADALEKAETNVFPTISPKAEEAFPETEWTNPGTLIAVRSAFELGRRSVHQEAESLMAFQGNDPWDRGFKAGLRSLIRKDGLVTEYGTYLENDIASGSVTPAATEEEARAAVAASPHDTELVTRINKGPWRDHLGNKVSA